MGELLSLREFVAGTAVLVASSSESLTLSELATGTATILGVSAESIVFAEASTGYLDNLGISRETLTFSERLTGAATILGTSRESLVFAERASSELWGQSSEALIFTESATGVSLITGVSAEALSFTEHVLGTVVQADDGVWCINLFHGGHSRYTGDLTGASPVASAAITPATDLGKANVKYLRDIYLHLRTAGGVKITTTTDEQIVYEGAVVASDGKAGMHRIRDQRPAGIKGTNWQFKIENVEGSDFTLKSSEPVPLPSKRTAP